MLKGAILCVPCGGFGDVIFCVKLAGFLKDWYNIHLTILSPFPDMFRKLGYTSNLYQLKSKHALREGECFEMKHFNKPILPKQDVIFVAPLIIDEEPSIRKVQKLFPYANKQNILFFSEYNHSLDSRITFQMGLGKGKSGIFITKPKVSSKRPYPGKYAVAYIAGGDHIPGVKKCFVNFITMVARKYSHISRFSVIVPKAILQDYDLGTALKGIKQSVYIRYQDRTVLFKEGDNNSRLLIDTTVFPVKNDVMLSLVKYSVDEILLTGDQSVSDVVSCCPSKTVYYQIVPWKKNFANSLAKYLPNRFLSKASTSCGSLSSLRFDGNSKKLVKEWDFKKLGKPKLDYILDSILNGEKWH